jgi:hypothetical protein
MVFHITARNHRMGGEGGGGGWGRVGGGGVMGWGVWGGANMKILPQYLPVTIISAGISDL